MKYRHELKFMISKNQAEVLKQRLSLVMDVDQNSVNIDHTYQIRSLYFDDFHSSAYYEKLDGVEFRKKYRIRLYNFDDSFLRLECKYKHNTMTSKEQVLINKKDCIKIIEGKYDEITVQNDLYRKFLNDMKVRSLKPSVIVDYTRLAYVYPISEVRVTFDSKVKSGAFQEDLLNFDLPMSSMLDDEEVILEVKFNEIIPEHLAMVLSTVPMVRQAFSKFAICRSIK